MAVFFSFHYQRDAWRVQQVAQMGSLEGQPILNSQAWEEVKRRGDQAIKNWIHTQMRYKTAVVVLIGAQTASRPWVQYEIKYAWEIRKPLVGVRINGLAALSGTDPSGPNPFDRVKLANGHTVGAYVPIYTPSGFNSQQVYANIRNNLKSWASNAYKRP